MNPKGLLNPMVRGWMKDGVMRAEPSAALLRSRRSFLRAVGGGALALPFFRSLEFSAAHAQTGEKPMTFVAVYYPHGVSSPLFRRQDGDTEDEFDITFTESRSGDQCVLAPLADFKDKLMILDGVDYVSGANGHDAPRTALTGSGTNGKGPSIDQYLAVTAGLGADTQISSVVLGVGTNGADHTDNVSYAEGGTSLPKTINPTETFKLLFGDIAAQNDPAQAAALEAKRRNGQSVIDYIRADIGRLQGRLAAPEAQKLDQHLTALRELEKGLSAFEGSCQVPDEPMAIAKIQRYNGGEPNFETITNLQVDMLAQAIACDITRFGTLWLADLSAGAVAGTGITDPAYSSSVDVHNSIAHSYSIERGPGTTATPSTWKTLGVQNRYSYSKVARLLQKLKDLDSFDNALVMAVTDMGDTANHTSTDVPIVLAGGANDRLRMGRYVSLQSNCPPDNYWCNDAAVFKPVNQVLVAIAQAFGADVDSFGEPTNPAHAKGALSEMA